MKLTFFHKFVRGENTLRRDRFELFCVMCDCVKGASATYSPQTVYSIIPATATHGSNVVYQQNASAVSNSVVRGDASAFYYSPTYMQMTPHQMTAPASGCAVPGILVHGPPHMQIYPAAGSHPQPETPFPSRDGSARGKTDGLRTGRSQPAVQVYIPPAQRQ